MEEPLTSVRVELTGQDGNSYSILARVRKALIDAGYTDLAEEYIKEATSGDRDHLLQTTMRFVHVD